jgi:hypothetical protein
LASLTCTRPASISWRIASARLERRRSKRKSSICSTRLRGKEIVVTHAGGRSAFSNMAMRPRDSKREATAKRGRPAPRGRQAWGLAAQPCGARCSAPAWSLPAPMRRGRHLGDPGGATLCGSVTPQALRASYHGNVASIPSKVRCPAKKRYVLSLTCRERFTSL